MYRAGVSSFGKTFTQGLCFTVYMLDELHKLGIPNPPAVITPPDIKLRSRVVLPPGGTMTIRPLVKLDADAPRTCTLSYAGAASECILGQTTLTWQVKPGTSLGPEIRLRAPARPGRVVLPVALALGDKRETRELHIEATAPAGTNGKAVGWITGSGDPLGTAAKHLGIPATPIADLAKADLAGYGTIILGDEAP